MFLLGIILAALILIAAIFFGFLSDTKGTDSVKTETIGSNVELVPDKVSVKVEPLEPVKIIEPIKIQRDLSSDLFSFSFLNPKRNYKIQSSSSSCESSSSSCESTPAYFRRDFDSSSGSTSSTSFDLKQFAPRQQNLGGFARGTPNVIENNTIPVYPKTASLIEAFVIPYNLSEGITSVKLLVVYDDTPTIINKQIQYYHMTNHPVVSVGFSGPTLMITVPNMSDYRIVSKVTVF